MKISYRIVVLFFIFSCMTSVKGLDSLTTHFRKGLNNDLWEATFLYNRAKSPLSYLIFRETGYLSRLRVNSTENKWKTKDDLHFELIRPLTSSLGYRFKANGLIFSDQQTGFINDIKTHALGVGFRYYKRPIDIPLMLGIKDDRRFEQEDQGFFGDIRCHIPTVEWGDYEHSINSEYKTDRLNKRKNDDISLHYRVQRQFYEGTLDTLNYTFSKQRRDYYISKSGDIESREEQNQILSNHLRYHLNRSFFYTLHGSIQERRLQFNRLTGDYTGPTRRRTDFTVEGGMNFAWRFNKFTGNLLINFSEEEQNYQIWKTEQTSYFSGLRQIQTPDNHSKISYMVFNTQWMISFTDTLNMHASVLKTEYNTPDDNNIDDRDELRFRVDLRYKRRFSNELLTRWNLSFHMHHLIYLSGKKSAENNWSRILKFNPTLHWHPVHAFRMTHSIEILANYVDYDFDHLLAGIRSFLYRKFKMEDTLFVQISPQTNFQTIYRLELDENGKLLWAKWLEQKLMDRQSHTIQCMFTFVPLNRFRIGSGYSYYVRKGYRYKNDIEGTKREKHIHFRSHGPIMMFLYHGSRLWLNVKASSIATKTLTVEKQLLTRIDLNMRWLL